MTAFGPNHHAAIVWHSYVGTGTVSTNDSFNVSALADLGTGHYRTSFSNSTSNTGYSVTTSANFNDSQCDIAGVVSRATTSCNTDCMHDDGGARDMADVYLTLHGDI